MSADVTDGVSARERLGLSPDATDAEVRETYRELERFLAPSSVPRRLQVWAARERAAAGRALGAEKPPTPAPVAPKPAKPKPRPSDLPDFFDEDIRDESPAPRRVAAQQKRPSPARPGAQPARRRRSGLLTWRSAVLVLALLIVVGGIAYASIPNVGTYLSTLGLGGGPANLPAASAEPTPIPLDTARVAELTKAVQANPNDTTSLFELGEMNFQSERWQDAIDWFTKLLAVDPTNTHARTDVGTANFNLGRYEEARAAWEEVVRRSPNDAQAHYNLGFYYLNSPTPDMDKAIAEWQKVVDISPDSQLGQTAKTHIDALKAASGQTAPTPTAAAK